MCEEWIIKTIVHEFVTSKVREVQLVCVLRSKVAIVRFKFIREVNGTGVVVGAALLITLRTSRRCNRRKHCEEILVRPFNHWIGRRWVVMIHVFLVIVVGGHCDGGGGVLRKQAVESKSAGCVRRLDL